MATARIPAMVLKHSQWLYQLAGVSSLLHINDSSSISSFKTHLFRQCKIVLKRLWKALYKFYLLLLLLLSTHGKHRPGRPRTTWKMYSRGTSRDWAQGGLWRRQKWQLKIGLFRSFSPVRQPVQKCMMLRDHG